MPFHYNKEIKLNIKIDGKSIPQVEHFKFIGFMIDNKLEWNQHFTLLFKNYESNGKCCHLRKSYLIHI